MTDIIAAERTSNNVMCLQPAFPQLDTHSMSQQAGEQYLLSFNITIHFPDGEVSNDRELGQQPRSTIRLGQRPIDEPYEVCVYKTIQ